MRKLFAMMIVLGTVASFGVVTARDHSPPGKDHKFAFENIIVGNVVAVQMDQLTIEQSNQVLITEEITPAIAAVKVPSFVTGASPIGRSVFLSSLERMDRSQFRWCGLPY